MARPLRIEFPGGVYHITSRGNGRQAIFPTEADRKLFLDLLGQAIDRFQWLCHAYCLMANHYHLLIETPEANLSRGMRHLNGVYTQRFNHDFFQKRRRVVYRSSTTHLIIYGTNSRPVPRTLSRSKRYSNTCIVQHVRHKHDLSRPIWDRQSSRREDSTVGSSLELSLRGSLDHHRYDSR